MARLVLSQVDGRTTIAAIAEASGLSADLACRIVEALQRDGRITLPGSGAEASHADPEIADSGGTGTAGVEFDSLAADVDRLASEMGSLNYYELLSVEPDVDRKALRSAYFAASKRYHPDRAFGPRAAELGKKMEAIFTRITRAYETLSSSEERAAYDAYIAGQIDLWKIERQLKDAVALTKKLDAPPAGTPTPEPAAPTFSGAPAAVYSPARTVPPAASARPKAVMTTIAPERRPPEKAPAGTSPRAEAADDRRQQWKKERMGRALGMLLTTPPPAPTRPSAPDLEERVERAALAIDHGKHADAVRILQEVLAAGGDRPRARQLLKRAEAGAMKELAIGYLRQARYERQHGDLEAARAHYDKAISADPSSLDARHQLAEMLIEHKLDLRRALNLCREVIGLGGQRAKYFVTLGEILLLSKDKERAADAFERALSLEPDNKDIKKKLKVCRG